MQSGRTYLDEVNTFPGLFCKYVTLNRNNFISGEGPWSKIKVILTVSWEDEKKMTGERDQTIQQPHDASAVWSEQVSTSGFRACVLVSGRHLATDFRNSQPRVHWQAFQNEFFRKNNFMHSGSVPMDTWYTGAQCKNLTSSESFLRNSSVNVYASVEHLEAKDYKNAMTVWSEITTSRSGDTAVRVCARELQNFDGIHKGIIIVGDFVVNCFSVCY